MFVERNGNYFSNQINAKVHSAVFFRHGDESEYLKYHDEIMENLSKYYKCKAIMIKWDDFSSVNQNRYTTDPKSILHIGFGKWGIFNRTTFPTIESIINHVDILNRNKDNLKSYPMVRLKSKNPLRTIISKHSNDNYENIYQENEDKTQILTKNEQNVEADLTLKPKSTSNPLLNQNKFKPDSLQSVNNCNDEPVFYHKKFSNKKFLSEKSKEKSVVAVQNTTIPTSNDNIEFIQRHVSFSRVKCQKISFPETRHRVVNEFQSKQNPKISNIILQRKDDRFSLPKTKQYQIPHAHSPYLYLNKRRRAITETTWCYYNKKLKTSNNKNILPSTQITSASDNLSFTLPKKYLGNINSYVEETTPINTMTYTNIKNIKSSSKLDNCLLSSLNTNVHFSTPKIYISASSPHNIIDKNKALGVIVPNPQHFKISSNNNELSSRLQQGRIINRYYSENENKPSES